ncbi:phosphoribosyltransferase domain-containing protein [Oceanisphaera sp. IT1-181]|uniref:phosphoribosyltransferase domain-containing protein n=1 Tax=Oceanisphaera sp. IT1-181 TaxID=3081199 RepID=UPI0029C9EC5B|nr:phosphoribosyltransferase domain-containing protein [Oceanisphaera sp. IT1-181]
MKHYQLTTGRLSVTPQPARWTCADLFNIAERRNPKRAFLFVSKVLGRHMPVSPGTMRAVYRDLAEQIPDDLPGPVLFVGMAETAVGLAAGVHQEYRTRRTDTCLLTSTRHPVEGDLWCEFKEEHSHATDHLIYWPADAALRQQVAQAASLVLVDDEATTGNTFVNLLTALRQAGQDGLPNLQQVCAVTLTDWSGDALASRTELPVQSINLLAGQWSWQADADATLPTMPMVNVTERGAAKLSERQDWGRLGVADSPVMLGRDITATQGERILVLGSGEFVWQPFLLAERLAQAGATVHYSSTTRSPISVGHAIETALSFTDNYGLGIPNYTYNIFPERYDRIILCSETPRSAWDPQLLTALHHPEFAYYE